MSPYAIVAGVGSGTGASVARKFAAAYPVACLSRTPANYEPLVKEINAAGGKAIGVSADVSNADSMKEAVQKIESELGNEGCAAAVLNAAGGFVMKPFLELSEEDFMSCFLTSGAGAFHFSQATLPLLLKANGNSPKHPPTLIFTGATASIKGSAKFAAFAAGKFAFRALNQSLAREFGPKGVHVAHAIIDGAIDIPKTKEWDLGPDGKISADAIADAYWHLHTQPKTSFTWEIDMRPGVEKW